MEEDDEETYEDDGSDNDNAVFNWGPVWQNEDVFATIHDSVSISTKHVAPGPVVFLDEDLLRLTTDVAIVAVHFRVRGGTVLEACLVDGSPDNPVNRTVLDCSAPEARTSGADPTMLQYRAVWADVEETRFEDVDGFRFVGSTDGDEGQVAVPDAHTPPGVHMKPLMAPLGWWTTRPLLIVDVQPHEDAGADPLGLWVHIHYRRVHIPLTTLPTPPPFPRYCMCPVSYTPEEFRGCKVSWEGLVPAVPCALLQLEVRLPPGYKLVGGVLEVSEINQATGLTADGTEGQWQTVFLGPTAPATMGDAAPRFTGKLVEAGASGDDLDRIAEYSMGGVSPYTLSSGAVRAERFYGMDMAMVYCHVTFRAMYC